MAENIALVGTVASAGAHAVAGTKFVFAIAVVAVFAVAFDDSSVAVRSSDSTVYTVVAADGYAVAVGSAVAVEFVAAVGSVVAAVEFAVVVSVESLEEIVVEFAQFAASSIAMK